MPVKTLECSRVPSHSPKACNPQGLWAVAPPLPNLLARDKYLDNDLSHSLKISAFREQELILCSCWAWLPGTITPGCLGITRDCCGLGDFKKGFSRSVLESLPGQYHCKLLPITIVPMLLAIASAIKPAIWTKHWGQLALMSSDSISVRSNIVCVVLCIVWRRRWEWAGTDG